MTAGSTVDAVDEAERIDWATANEILDLADKYADQAQRTVRAYERLWRKSPEIRDAAIAAYKELVHCVFRLTVADHAGEPRTHTGANGTRGGEPLPREQDDAGEPEPVLAMAELCTWCSAYPPRFTLVAPWEVQEVCSIVCMEQVGQQWRKHDQHTTNNTPGQARVGADLAR